MKNRMLVLATGLPFGSLLIGAIVWVALPHLRIVTHESRFSVDGTIQALTRVAREQGWSTPKVYVRQASLAAQGHPDMSSLKILSLCQPHHACKVLALDQNKRLSSIMPCRFGVYQLTDGKVDFSGMNIGLMSQTFGPEVGAAMQ